MNVAHDTAKAITLTGSDPNTPALPLTYAVATRRARLALGLQRQHRRRHLHARRRLPRRRQLHLHRQQRDEHQQPRHRHPERGHRHADGQPPVGVRRASTRAKAITLTGTDDDIPALPLTFAIATAADARHALGLQRHHRRRHLHARPPATTAPTASPSPPATAPTPAPRHGRAQRGDRHADGQPPVGQRRARHPATAITLTGTDPDVPALPLTYAIATARRTARSRASTPPPAPSPTRPTAGYHGADSFTFTASNGTNTSPAATVSLNVAVGTPTANRPVGDRRARQPGHADHTGRPPTTTPRP